MTKSLRGIEHPAYDERLKFGIIKEGIEVT